MTGNETLHICNEIMEISIAKHQKVSFENTVSYDKKKKIKKMMRIS